MVITILHLKLPKGWDAVDRKDEFFKQIKTKVRNCLKTFRHPVVLDVMDLNIISNTGNIIQVINKGAASMQKRKKVNMETLQEQLEI